MAGRSYVMMGSLSNFTLRQVLDVVGLSRQHTVVELRGTDGARVASINLKGGHLVQSDTGEPDPRAALHRALQAPESCTFHVFRLDDADRYQSFGQLVRLLAEEAIAAATSPAPPAEPASQPAPAAAAPAPVPEPPTPAAAPPVTPYVRPASQPAAAAPPAAPARAPEALGVSVAVASPKGGVGKTTIALNLGISLAQRGFRVIVIDADINGDLLSLINARGSAEQGAYDLLQDPAQLQRALRRTVVQGLLVLPAVGRTLPASAMLNIDRTAKWRALIRRAMDLADIVLVDCPAGIVHTTSEILQGVTHVLGVFQAETVASRSFEMFERGLAALNERERPKVVGVVVNMLREDAASARVYKELVAADQARRVLPTAINRSEAFEEAAATARPIRLHDGDAARKLAWLFDNLASELASRLPLAQAPAGAGGSFLL